MEIGLIIIILILLAERHFDKRELNRERRTVLNALMARDPIEFTNLQAQVEPKVEKVVEDVIPMEAASEEEFAKFIDKQI